MLEARLSELEARLRTIETPTVSPVVSLAPLASVDRASVASVSRPSAAPEQPEDQGNWVISRRKHNTKPESSAHHLPLHVSNRFSHPSLPPKATQLSLALWVSAQAVQLVHTMGKLALITILAGDILLGLCLTLTLT